MTELVKLRGDWHPEVLADGRTIAPGEPFDRALLDPNDPGDARLIDEGLIIDSEPAQTDLQGEDLTERAKALEIKGRSKMTADELREAVAQAESHTTAPGGDA